MTLSTASAYLRATPLTIHFLFFVQIYSHDALLVSPDDLPNLTFRLPVVNSLEVVLDDVELGCCVHGRNEAETRPPRDRATSHKSQKRVQRVSYLVPR